ncbi:acyltransferase [[Clostridium] symbiosum]|uniref:acyltransferase n=1 Tax=Clostridium symbiosum TaxID=1512 RepID=UPI001D0907E8|nr:acyltransferase [[Clostridium] symbiosum]MCB6608192.1 acyltransferase [[Clostridium] symbiosum]MCB6930854.1 acyltransferase [[Clostridium] symbiosum]
MNRKVERDTMPELLRLISIFGIIMMHLFGIYRFESSGTNLLFGIGINTLFNCGVSIFILISGYYGIKFSVNSIVKLWIITVFYSLMQVIVSMVMITHEFNIRELWLAFFPFSTRKYWFISSYLLLMFFSRFLNMAVEFLEKKQLGLLIASLAFVFSVLPTLTQLQVMNDCGKGPLNLLLIYFIGGYIKKYDVDMNKNKIVTTLLGLFFTQFVMNCITTKYRGGWYLPFSYDCSMFIVISSSLIFLLAKKSNYQNHFINKIAKRTLGIYLLEGTIEILMESIGVVFDFYSPLLPLYITIEAIAIFVICLVIDSVREILMIPLFLMLDKINGILKPIIKIVHYRILD